MESFPDSFKAGSGCTAESLLFFLEPLIENLKQETPQVATIPYDLLNTEKKVSLLNQIFTKLKQQYTEAFPDRNLVISINNPNVSDLAKYFENYTLVVKIASQEEIDESNANSLKQIRRQMFYEASINESSSFKINYIGFIDGTVDVIKKEIEAFEWEFESEPVYHTNGHQGISYCPITLSVCAKK